MVTEELYIEDSNGTLQIVDLPKGQVAMNFQSTNLLKMEYLYTNYSQAIKLPKTNRNCAVFDNIDMFDINSDYSSKKHRCWYYVDGINVLGGVAIFIIDDVSETFNGRIVMDVLDVFQQMSNTKVADFEFGFSLKRNLNAISQQGNYDWYKYAHARFSNSGGPTLHSELQYMLPFLNLSSLVKRIVERFGYSLIYEGSKSDCYFPIAAKRKKEWGSITDSNGDIVDGYFNPKYSFEIVREQIGMHIIASGSIPNNLGGALSYGYTGSIGETLYMQTYYRVYGVYLSIKTQAPATVKISNMQFTATAFQGDISAVYLLPHISIAKKSDVYSGGSFSLRDLLNPNISTVIVGETASIAQTQTIGEDTEFEVEANEEYVVFAMSPVLSLNLDEWKDYMEGVPATFSGEVEISAPFDEDEALVGEEIDVEKNIPFETCADMFTLYRMAMGGFIRLNEKAKTIAIIEVDSILNFSSAADWSKKLVMDKKAQIIRFKSDFGQNNYIKLLENSETKEVDKVNFQMNNDGASYEHDILTIDAETTAKFLFSVMGVGGSIKKETADLTTYTIEFNDGRESVSRNDFGGVRLVNLAEDYSNYVYVGTQSVMLRLVASPVTAASIAEGTYKPLFERILKKLRVVEATFMLDAMDIANFDQYRPVYVEYFGAHFFVNKISNWIAGKPCKVELIKL
jgi:hypothetical protein